MKQLFCIGLILALFSACQTDKNGTSASVETDYQFFVAGHTYGKPSVNNVGMHPPFVAKLEQLKQSPKLELGLLTGDIVIWSNHKEWDEVDTQLDSLQFPVYFAPGNHDVSNRKVYEFRYGSPTYRSFIHGSDLFLLLDPNLDEWNISGQQLAFVQSQLAQHGSNVQNIFVFFHQVLWWEPDNIYSKLKLNSKQNRADQINFWTELEPIFHGLPNAVYLFAGDVGAFPNGSEFMFHQYDNISLVASGMGGGERDNIILVDVDVNGQAHLRLVALNGTDENALGKLEDYRLPE